MNKHYVRKAVSPEDQLAFQQMMAVAFVYSMNSEEFKPASEEEISRKLSETWVSGAISDDGTPLEPTSGYVAHNFNCWFDGQKVPTTGIGGVASFPEGRSGGGIRSIFETQLPDSYEKGFVLSILFPFSHVFYRKFGYELIQRTKYYEVPVLSLKRFVTDRPVKLVKDAAELQEIHDTFGSRMSLTISRKPGQWHFVSKDPIKAVNYTYKIGEEAFVTFTKKEKPGGGNYTIKVRDLAYSTMDGLKSIFGFFYSLRAQYDKAAFALPDSVPMMDLLPECYEVDCNTGAHGMARIVNVEKALSMKHFEGAGSFTVKVLDEQIAENNAVFTVTYGPEGNTITRTPDVAADLTVTIQRLTQLVLGALTIDQALWLDGTECPCPDKLRPLFPLKDFFFNDPF